MANEQKGEISCTLLTGPCLDGPESALVASEKEQQVIFVCADKLLPALYGPRCPFIFEAEEN